MWTNLLAYSPGVNMAVVLALVGESVQITLGMVVSLHTELQESAMISHERLFNVNLIPFWI
jgi:hypothetical protein